MEGQSLSKVESLLKKPIRDTGLNPPKQDSALPGDLLEPISSLDEIPEASTRVKTAFLLRLLRAPLGILPDNPVAPEFLWLFFDKDTGKYEVLNGKDDYETFPPSQEFDTWRRIVMWEVGMVHTILLENEENLELTWIALKRLGLDRERQWNFRQEEDADATRMMKDAIRLLLRAKREEDAAQARQGTD